MKQRIRLRPVRSTGDARHRLRPRDPAVARELGVIAEVRTWS